MTGAAGTQTAELNVTLAELEGCAAQLRNEAATLRDTRVALMESLPTLVAQAVGPAIEATIERSLAAGVAPTIEGAIGRTVGDLRLALSELGAALTEAVPAAVFDALAPAFAEPRATAQPDEGPGGTEEEQQSEGSDLVTQLHQAQDEAAEWFSIVIDEAVRQAVDRHLTPLVARTSSTAAGPPGAVRAESLPGAAPSAEDAGGPEDPAVVDPSPGGRGNGSEVGVPSARGPRAAGAADGHDDPGAQSWESAVACVLPGVAVGPTLALGVHAALGRARLRRRRRRRAGAPSAGLFRHDPFAGEVPRRLERFAVARRELAFSTDGERPGPRLLVPAGEQEGQELPIDLSSGPLALVGTGAADVARALVTTVLACWDPDVARVVAVGDLLPTGPSFPGLERMDDLAVALEHLEPEVDRRRALVAETGGDLGRWRSRHADQALPQLVLATPVLPGTAGPLATLLEEGAQVGVTAVVVGGKVEGATAVALQGGGRVRSVSPEDPAPALTGARLFTLAPAPAAEILEVLGAARTDEEVTVPAAATEEPFPVLAAAEPPPLQVQLLGIYRIEADGKEIRSGLRAKARELLAFYLLHPEGTSLDAATEALWPEADPGRGSEWFWTALGNLRSLLRTATGTKELKVIERDGDRYRIEPVFDVDLWRFQQALPPPGASTGDPEWAAALQAAADLYGGELLTGVDWPWAEVPREDLRRRAVDVLVSLAAIRLVAGDARAALDTLSRAVEVDPVAEQVYRRIMRLHARQARLDEAEATFRRLKARLDELHLEPTAESAQLVKELSLSSASS